jgi:vacuolar protein sorting-associated protein 52
MTTNMHIVQTTLFLKYRSLYTFLLRHATNVAMEVQKAYIATARVYYETGFRRYMRSLGWIKVSGHVCWSWAPFVLSDIAQARIIEKDPGLVSGLDSPETQTGAYLERLSYARIDGPGVTLAYMADDKTHVIPQWLNVIRPDVLTFFSFFSYTTERRCGGAPPVGSVGFDG